MIEPSNPKFHVNTPNIYPYPNVKTSFSRNVNNPYSMNNINPGKNYTLIRKTILHLTTTPPSHINSPNLDKSDSSSSILFTSILKIHFDLFKPRVISLYRHPHLHRAYLVPFLSLSHQPFFQNDFVEICDLQFLDFRITMLNRHWYSYERWKKDGKMRSEIEK